MIVVNHQIELHDTEEYPISLLHVVQQDLTLLNPAYEKAVKYGKGTPSIPKTIKLFRLEQQGERIRMILPRGYGSMLRKRCQEHRVNWQIKNERLILPPVSFQSRIKLRDYQEAAVQRAVKYRQGGIVAPCGAGKTMIILESMVRIRQPSLVIVHTKELAEQMIERAIQVLDISREEIGFIGRGSFTIGERMTVAMIQTLAKTDIDAIADRFGAIFVDEAHHLAAKSFYYPISKFPALYRLWVSATPERSDGLSGMVMAAGGPVLYIIQQCQVPTIIPELQVIKTAYSKASEKYTDLINDLIQDEVRNNLIVQTIAREAPGNYLLVLSDRVEHLEILKSMLVAALPHLQIEILTGKMRPKDREDVMNRVQNYEIDILLATQLAREGLDIKHLNRLFLTTPKKAAGAVQQEVGRIMRPEEGKEDAIVFDFWDANSPMLKAQFWPRREVYQKIGMNIDWKEILIEKKPAVLH